MRRHSRRQLVRGLFCIGFILILPFILLDAGCQMLRFKR